MSKGAKVYLPQNIWNCDAKGIHFIPIALFIDSGFIAGPKDYFLLHWALLLAVTKGCCWALAVIMISSRALERLYFNPSSYGPLRCPFNSYPVKNLKFLPSVKQASGSNDSSGSSSTDSAPSPGGRISTVLPSDELKGWGSTSSFCMDGAERGLHNGLGCGG